jgi:hypothetical protein
VRRALFAIAGGAAAVGVTLIAAASGCTITLPGADGGAGSEDSGTGAEAEAAAQTVGDQCTTIFTELCTQAINRCGLQGFSVDQCVSADMPSCCTGTVCNETSQSPASAVTGCTQAIDTEDCNALVNSMTPAACQGVPQKP